MFILIGEHHDNITELNKCNKERGPVKHEYVDLWIDRICRNPNECIDLFIEQSFVFRKDHYPSRFGEQSGIVRVREQFDIFSRFKEGDTGQTFTKGLSKNVRVHQIDIRQFRDKNTDRVNLLWAVKEQMLSECNICKQHNSKILQDLADDILNMFFKTNRSLESFKMCYEFLISEHKLLGLTLILLYFYVTKKS